MAVSIIYGGNQTGESVGKTYQHWCFPAAKHLYLETQKNMFRYVLNL